MLEFFTKWIYCCSQLRAFWGCDLYRQECHRLTFGMLANLRLRGIKEGAIPSSTSLVATLLLRSALALRSCLFIPAPVQLLTPSCAEPTPWAARAVGKNMKPLIPLKKKQRERKKGSKEASIVLFPLIFNELLASLKSV